MLSRERADAIDSRWIYWSYAGVAWTMGAVLLGGAGGRLTGAMVMAAGCFAAALASVDDPPGRRRGLLWMAIAHNVVGSVMQLQRQRGYERAEEIVLGAGFLLLYFYITADGEVPGAPQPLISLFGSRGASTERLRSQYEQQIRLAAGQEERNRLARDLHDSVKQQIFVIQTAAATAQARFDEDPGGARVALDEVRTAAREAMAEMEAMLEQLRAAPLENTGLVEALKRQAEALGFRTGAQVDFRVGALPPSSALVPGAQQAVFRVAQEALANIGRHARATHVTVALDAVPWNLRLSIQDNGAGFNPNDAARGMGISNMRARAEEFGGTFELNSRPGGGTDLLFTVPYSPPAESNVLRGQVVSAGILLVVQVVFAVLHQSAVFAFLSLIFGIRFALAWRRARKYQEVPR